MTSPEERKAKGESSPLVYEFEIAMKNKDLRSMGEIINLAWIYKKEISPKTSNSMIDDIIVSGIKSGAYGGKLLGAGKSGFMLFYVNKSDKKRFLNGIKRYLNVPFKFSFNGSHVIQKGY